LSIFVLGHYVVIMIPVIYFICMCVCIAAYVFFFFFSSPISCMSGRKVDVFARTTDG